MTTENAAEPTVSVIITTYRHEPYIEQAIRSAAEQQTSFPIEVLVGEDCSPDGTKAICERLQAEYPDRVRVFAHNPNIGGHDNVDFLWTRARGKYIAWLEGDDYWTDMSKLQRQVEAMERNPEASLCFHNVWHFVEGEPDHPGRLDPGDQEELALSFGNLVFANRITTCSVMYRRGLVPGLPPWIYPLSLGDWPMHLLHAAQGPAVFLPQTMAAYRQHPGGGWTRLSGVDRLKRAIDAIDAVGLHVPHPLRLLCEQSAKAMQQEIDLACARDDVHLLQGELAQRNATLEQTQAEYAAALERARAEQETEVRRLTELLNRAPLWRRAWRKVWRPIYRTLKGA